MESKHAVFGAILLLIEDAPHSPQVAIAQGLLVEICEHFKGHAAQCRADGAPLAARLIMSFLEDEAKAKASIDAGTSFQCSQSTGVVASANGG